MSRTVAKLKGGVSGFLTGTNLDNVTNLYNALERGVRNMLGKISVPEASTADNTVLYDGVYDYLSPTYIFGGAIRDIRPVGINRTPWDEVYRKPIKEFDITKVMLPNGYSVTFETINAVNLMRIAQVRATPRITLDTMTVVSGWGVGGSASAPVVDRSFYYTSPASLRFTLTGSSSGYLEKTLSNSVDLTSYQGVGVIFLALQIPTGLASSLTSVVMRLGSSSANYYQVTATQGFLGAFTAGDFTLVALDLAQATTVGSPVITAMKYVRLTFAHTATLTNIRVGNLFIALPSPHKIFYESTAIFSHSGTLSNSITDDNDLILLNDSAYNIYEHEAAMAVALQQGGSAANGLVQSISSVLNGRKAKNGTIIEQGLIDLYRANNPSEELRQVGSYYD